MTTSSEAHIASILVQALPAALEQIASAIEALEGAEVHARDPVGKILVTLETDSEAGLLSKMSQIQDMDSVINALLVYHEVDFPDQQTEHPEEQRQGKP